MPTRVRRVRLSGTLCATRDRDPVRPPNRAGRGRRSPSVAGSRIELRRELRPVTTERAPDVHRPLALHDRSGLWIEPHRTGGRPFELAAELDVGLDDERVHRAAGGVYTLASGDRNRVI